MVQSHRIVECWSKIQTVTIKTLNVLSLFARTELFKPKVT